MASNNVKNIDFNDGRVCYQLNGDPNRCIYINPTDTGIVERFRDALNNIKNFKGTDAEKENRLNMAVESNKMRLEHLDDFVDVTAEKDKYVREQIDYILDYPASQVIFGRAYALSVLPSGEMFYEVALDAILKIIKAEFEEAEKAFERKMKKAKKYTNKYLK